MNVPKKMKAAAVVGKEKCEVREFTVPTPAHGEVLIRIERCLICTWEMRMFSGESSTPLPFIPGHEASGVVVDIPVGTNTHFKPGDRVVFKTLEHCGHCTYCYQGYNNMCIGEKEGRNYDGTGASGGFAQYITLNVSKVLPVGETLSFEEAAFTEPLACCVHSVKRSGLQFGDTVVVIGAGIMGQLHALLARVRGARVIIVEPDPGRRQFALDAGAHVGIDPKGEDAVARVMELTNGEGAEIVFDTVTLPEVAEEAQKMIRKMGTLILYGSFHPNRAIDVDPNGVHYDEYVITGSFSPAVEDFFHAARLLRYGLVDVKPLLSEKYPLNKINDAMRAALSPETYRVAVDLSNTQG
ncbi:MAG: zinc-dependent alcohol dehydrogenase [Spirochaetaceae bacterium]